MIKIKIFIENYVSTVENNFNRFIIENPNINITQLSTTEKSGYFILTILYTDNNITNTDKL